MHNKYAPGNLSIRSEKYRGMKVELCRNEVQTAERQLGIRMFMNGTDSAEFLFRLDQARVLAGKVQSSPFNRDDAETIYKERWLSSVGYCLPITQFTDKQFKAIQSPFFNAILPKMGFNRHFPIEVVTGPKQYQDKQLTNYATFQYISHVERFVGTIRHGKEMGNLLRIQMDQHQQIMGTQEHFYPCLAIGSLVASVLGFSFCGTRIHSGG